MFSPGSALSILVMSMISNEPWCQRKHFKIYCANGFQMYFLGWSNHCMVFVCSEITTLGSKMWCYFLDDISLLNTDLIPFLLPLIWHGARITRDIYKWRKGNKGVVPIGEQGGRGEPSTSYIQDTFNVHFFTEQVSEVWNVFDDPTGRKWEYSCKGSMCNGTDIHMCDSDCAVPL